MYALAEVTGGGHLQIAGTQGKTHLVLETEKACVMDRYRKIQATG